MIIEKIEGFVAKRYAKRIIKKNNVADTISTKCYKDSFEILMQNFPNLDENQYRRVYTRIEGLLFAKIMELTPNKSYESYRNNGRFLRDFKYICDFLKSEQDIDEDVYEDKR